MKFEQFMSVAFAFLGGASFIGIIVAINLQEALGAVVCTLLMFLNLIASYINMKVGE